MNLTILRTRGTAIESEHSISGVLCDASGDIKKRVGRPMVTTFRSAAKPFQLESNLDCLPPSVRDAIPESGLAVGAASHSAQDFHLEEVRKLWSRFEINESHLLCGGHWPMHEPTKEIMLQNHATCTAIHNNCSGKHSFMVAASNELGADSNYLPIEHPVQQRIIERLRQRAHYNEIDTVIDGCGVPCFVLPLEKMATAWAHVGVEMKRNHSSLGRIGHAMMNEARFVSGTDRLDLAINHAKAQPIVTKIGAEGLICGTYPNLDLGFAIKVQTGLGSIRPLATFEILNHWFPGHFSPQMVAPWTTVFNVVKKPVGRVEARWEG